MKRINKNIQEDISEGLNLQITLKNGAYKSYMKIIRSELNSPEEIFSYISQNPFINYISSIIEKLSNPTYMICASTLTLLLSATYIYFAKQLGYRYNYLIFILFFVIGYLLGLLGKLILKFIRWIYH